MAGPMTHPTFRIRRRLITRAGSARSSSHVRDTADRDTADRDTADRDTADRGAIAVLGALAVIPMIGLLAVIADLGMVHARRLELQTGTEAAALAAASAQAAGRDGCDDAEALIADNRSASTPVAVECAHTVIPGSTVITVSASTTEPLAFASLLGRDAADITASAAAVLGPAGSATGLRPLAICADHPALTAWAASGFTDDTVHRIDVESDGTTCGGDIPGNWAMIDFDGGSNSNAELQERIVDGYATRIDLPVTLDGDPGIPTPALDIDVLIGRTVTLPVFSSARNAGNGAEYDLTGIVAIEVVDVTMTGRAAERHLDVRFTTATMPDAVPAVPADGTATGWGVTTWGICALDGKGSGA